MCSPLTLFAFLGVIRQAFDNFMIEQTSDEILELLGKFGQQWQQVHRVGREGEATTSTACSDEFDQLAGTRRRALERPLQQLEDAARRSAASPSTASCSSDASTSTTSASSAP